MKRQRLDGAAAAAPSSAEVGLPSELWARVLSYAYFDEVLTTCTVSKFFLTDVAGQMKRLRIRSGDSMDVAPAVVARFSRVERVDVYAISDEPALGSPHFDLHLDCAALRNATPFLTNLPKLVRCTLTRQNGDEYQPDCESDYDAPNANEKWAGLIHSVCKAYQMGDFSDNVHFVGLIPYSGDICPWKQIPRIGSYRDDVACQTCDMICNSLPTRDILCEEDSMPCIRRENVVKIVMCRDGKNVGSTMTYAICNGMESAREYMPVMCPPDNPSAKRRAISFNDDQFDKIECFISNGGDPNHLSVRSLLLDKEREWHGDDCFLGRKRVLEVHTYERMRDLGFDVSESDFLVIDPEDERVSVRRFEGRVIKSQMDSGISLCNIEYVNDFVRRMAWLLRNGVLPGSPYGQVAHMEDVFGVDFSDHKEEIIELFAEMQS